MRFLLQRLATMHASFSWLLSKEIKVLLVRYNENNWMGLSRFYTNIIIFEMDYSMMDTKELIILGKKTFSTRRVTLIWHF